MKFSIVIVAYQRYQNIPCLLHSILSQNYDNFEVIILHDGYDKTHLDLIQPFLTDPRFRYFQSDVRYNDYGHSLRNKGFDLAKGDFIVQTNDDNYYTPNWLQEMADVLTEDPSINFVCYDMVMSTRNSHNHNGKDYGLFRPEVRHSYMDVGQFAVSADVVKGHRFNSSYAADGDFIEEIKHKLRSYYIDKILFVHN
jgi:glycosyltransferase involved in cell wall biosynthesis